MIRSDYENRGLDGTNFALICSEVFASFKGGEIGGQDNENKNFVVLCSFGIGRVP